MSESCVARRWFLREKMRQKMNKVLNVTVNPICQNVEKGRGILGKIHIRLFEVLERAETHVR